MLHGRRAVHSDPELTFTLFAPTLSLRVCVPGAPRKRCWWRRVGASWRCGGDCCRPSSRVMREKPGEEGGGGAGAFNPRARVNHWVFVRVDGVVGVGVAFVVVPGRAGHTVLRRCRRVNEAVRKAATATTSATIRWRRPRRKCDVEDDGGRGPRVLRLCTFADGKSAAGGAEMAMPSRAP
jgi:hypothetical protein